MRDDCSALGGVATGNTVRPERSSNSSVPNWLCPACASSWLNLSPPPRASVLLPQSRMGPSPTGRSRRGTDADVPEHSAAPGLDCSAAWKGAARAGTSRDSCGMFLYRFAVYSIRVFCVARIANCGDHRSNSEGAVGTRRQPLCGLRARANAAADRVVIAHSHRRGGAHCRSEQGRRSRSLRCSGG